MFVVTCPPLDHNRRLPMLNTLGHVTVVALLKSTLESLRLAFIEGGNSDIKFLIVNMKGTYPTLYSYLLTERVNFPVYQDTDSLNIWSLLDGEKDDMLIYDRCGQLTYHVRMPYSDLGYSIVQQVIGFTVQGNDPCTCTPVEINTMMMTRAQYDATTSIEEYLDLPSYNVWV
ncbi:putative selenoprotein P [Apostichopus japonicus]|uniref:Putative selenoprotein P n=1 Tax=Stichopus japonicus TaxID=307972 RepID=A0A2G8JD54_STIJA|nr:putative selenoprotein P [Apostichopus japonicus]